MSAPAASRVERGAVPLQVVDYLKALRRRWLVVAAVTVLVTGAALAVSLSSAKKYDATAELLFQRSDPVASLINPNGRDNSTDPERDLNTQVDLIKLDSIAVRVLRRIGAPRTLHQLLSEVSTKTSSTSDIVPITVRDRDRVIAARIANGFANEYVAYRLAQARRTLSNAATLAQQQYDALNELDKASSQGQQLLARKRELQIDSALQTGGVEVVRHADPPTSPSRPRPKLSGALGLFLGLLLGAAVALVLEFADRRLKDEDSIERAFGLPLLGTIPRTRRRGTASQADHAQREAFGLLAANLHASPAKYDTHVIMVTSSAPAEGKTSVTLGLARAFARLGKRVIVIEADLRRPTLPSFPARGQSGGLTSILAGTGVLTQELVWLDAESLEPVTLDDARDGVAFAILPAGTLPPNPQRLLSTPTMATVVEVARSLADVVLIDTPPVAAVNDAVALLPVVDDVLLIARLNVTTKDAVRRTLRIVGTLDINLAGVAVTDVPVATSGYGYYAAAPAREAPAEPARDEMPRDSTARV